MDYFTHYRSPLGLLTLSATDTHLTGLWFDGQKHAPPAPPPDAARTVFAQTRRWLDAYFAGRVPGFTPPLLLRATPFQQSVWKLLLAIPFGQTCTYGTLAAEIAAVIAAPRMSAQAVGGAVARNPVSIIVPCHRVVGAHGELTGYAGGLERKRALLALENAALGA